MLKKIILIAVIVVLAAGIIVGSSFGIVYGVANKTDVSVKFDEAETYQTFTGFGASSAWTFRPLGRDFSDDVQNQVIELLYGDIIGNYYSQKYPVAFGKDAETKRFCTTVDLSGKQELTDMNTEEDENG